MKHNNDQFTPIKLPEVHFIQRITDQGYFNVEIKNVWNKPNSKPTLSVEFEVIEGKSKGARIRRKFYQTEDSIKPLAYMCSAVGITGKLEHLQLLIGKTLTVLVIMKQNQNTGSFYPEIKLFLALQS